jgi:hypothetical protein
VDRNNIATSWRARLPLVLERVTEAQATAAGGADDYLTALLDDYGMDTDARGELLPRSLSGVASDGRDLSTLLYQPAIAALRTIQRGGTPAKAMAAGRFTTDMIVRTQVTDAARVADGVALAARPQLQGWVRMLSLPSCSRCILLAGRRYGWSAGFQRHPRLPVATVDIFRRPKTSQMICAPTPGQPSSR